MEHFLVTQISKHGYLAIILLMTAESACIPIPSEVIMTFAGALAGGLVLAGVHVHLNIVWVGLSGALGNLIGGLIAYAVGRAGGRPLLERWGKFILLRPKEIDKAERFFHRRGQLAVLVGRVIPVVRTFISLPAGVAEMPLGVFSLYTFLGSLPWVFALAAAGDALASNWKSVSNAFTPISIAFGVIIVGGIAFWYWRRIRANRGSRGAHARQG